MDEYAQLRALLDVAEAIGLDIRRAPTSSLGEGASDHPGGALVRLRGKEILFLDPAAPVADRIEVTAAALRGRPQIEDVYLRPEIRRLIEGE